MGLELFNTLQKPIRDVHDNFLPEAITIKRSRLIMIENYADRFILKHSVLYI
jgi:hypothetical protein